MALKSLPSWEERVPQTFSRTIMRGARPSSPSVCHKVPERPEGAGALSLQTGTAASERKILARERSPDEVGNLRQVRGGNFSHIATFQSVLTPIQCVGCGLFRSKSLANRQRQRSPSPARAIPAPAKNS